MNHKPSNLTNLWQILFWISLLAPPVAILAINLFIKPVLGEPRELGLREDSSIGDELLNYVVAASLFTSPYCGFFLAARCTRRTWAIALGGLFLSVLLTVVNLVIFFFGCSYRT